MESINAPQPTSIDSHSVIFIDPLVQDDSNNASGRFSEEASTRVSEEDSSSVSEEEFVSVCEEGSSISSEEGSSNVSEEAIKWELPWALVPV